MKKVELVFIGHTAAGTDIIEGSNIQKTTIGGGGFSPAVAASLKLAGHKIGLVSKIGDDDFGKEAQRYLKERRINTEGLKAVPNGQTTWVVTREASRGRRMIVDLGVSKEFNPPFPESYLRAFHIHLGSGPPQLQSAWLKRLRKELNFKGTISTDALEMYTSSYPNETLNVLEAVNLVFINETERNILSQFGKLSTKSPIILKRGPQGATYLSRDKKFNIPAPKVNVVHTTSAGEILAGVFLALRRRKFSVEKALERAVKIASLSVTDFGIHHLSNSLDKTSW